MKNKTFENIKIEKTYNLIRNETKNFLLLKRLNNIILHPYCFII